MKMLLRSMLYFPATSVRMISKAATLPVDATILDLEDAVSLEDKETARILAKDYVALIKRRGISTFVRVNSVASGLAADDLRAIAVRGLDGVMLAKTETRTDIVTVTKILRLVEKRSRLASASIRLIPLIESAKGVENSFQIASASKRVAGVAFGAGDYCRDLGRDVNLISKEEDELLYARSRIVNASRAAETQAIDTPFLGSLVDREAFLREVKLAARLGFRGKQCVHPSQVEPINESFSPTHEEVDRASRIVKAFKQAQRSGQAAISFEGKMVDIMTYRQALDLIASNRVIDEKRHKMTRLQPYVPLSEIFTKT